MLFLAAIAMSGRDGPVKRMSSPSSMIMHAAFGDSSVNLLHNMVTAALEKFKNMDEADLGSGF